MSRDQNLGHSHSWDSSRRSFMRRRVRVQQCGSLLSRPVLRGEGRWGGIEKRMERTHRGLLTYVPNRCNKSRSHRAYLAAQHQVLCSRRSKGQWRERCMCCRPWDLLVNASSHTPPSVQRRSSCHLQFFRVLCIGSIGGAHQLSSELACLSWGDERSVAPASSHSEHLHFSRVQRGGWCGGNGCVVALDRFHFVAHGSRGSTWWPSRWRRGRLRWHRCSWGANR